MSTNNEQFNIVNFIKSLDIITIFFVLLIIIFSLSFISKFLFIKSKQNILTDHKKIGTYSVNKICYDIEGITECIEIRKDIYNILLINETSNNDIPTLYIRK